MKRIMIASVAAMAIAGVAFADGPGNSSSDTLTVTVNLPKMVMVSGLDDITLNVTAADIANAGTSYLEAGDDFCVYSNISQAGSYNIQVSGSATAPTGYSYGLAGPDAQNLGMRVLLSDHASNGSGSISQTEITSGQQLSATADSGGNASRPRSIVCGDTGDNARLDVRFDDSELLGVQQGTYTGDLTVTVSAI